MAAALEAGYDLGALALLFVALSLLLTTRDLAQLVARVFDFSLFGYRPLHNIATAIENGIVGTLDDAIKGVEKLTAHFLSGLVDAFGMLIAIPLLLAFGVKAAFQYLWNHALQPIIHSIADPIKTTADKAISRVGTLENTVETDLGVAKRYAESQAAGAIHTAEGYADDAIRDAKGVLRGDIQAAKNAAEGYADTAVEKLRGIEDAAVAGAVGLAAEAKTAALTAAAGALATARGEISDVRREAIAAAAGALSTAEGEITAARAAAVAAAAGALSTAEAEIIKAEATAEQVAATALATAQAATDAAIGQVRSIAINLEDELHTIEGAAGAVGIAALIASIPALATLVNAFANEAGLGRAECRQKVGGICSTEPSLWGDLLSGLTLLGFAFSLRELVEVATPLAAELAPVIRKAA